MRHQRADTTVSVSSLGLPSGMCLGLLRHELRQLFLDSMGGGAWPFLVGGVICLVNSVNERDLNLLNSYT